MLNSGKNWRFLVLCDLEIWWMTLKNNRAPLLYYLSFVHHFKAIGIFKLELQSENAQFGSQFTIFFSRVTLKCQWRMTLKNNRVPLLSNIKLCVSFHCHMNSSTGPLSDLRYKYIWIHVIYLPKFFRVTSLVSHGACATILGCINKTSRCQSWPVTNVTASLIGWDHVNMAWSTEWHPASHPRINSSISGRFEWNFGISNFQLVAEVSFVRLPLCDCHWTSPMRSQHWFR